LPQSAGWTEVKNLPTRRRTHGFGVDSEARILLGPSESCGTADLARIELINFVTPYLAPMWHR
jgi:hypothetical protein